MSTTMVVQAVVVALFALTCGALAVAWMHGKLGAAAIVLFVVAVLTWTAALIAITGEYGDASGFATCDPNCTAVHYVSAVAFLAPPLLIALAAAAALVARGRRWRLRRSTTGPNHG